MGDRTARGSRSGTDEREASRKPQKSEGGGPRRRAPQRVTWRKDPSEQEAEAQHSPISVFKHWPDAVSQIRLQSKDNTLLRGPLTRHSLCAQVSVRHKLYSQHLPAFTSSATLHSFTRSLNNLMS